MLKDLNNQSLTLCSVGIVLPSRVELGGPCQDHHSADMMAMLIVKSVNNM